MDKLIMDEKEAGILAAIKTVADSPADWTLQICDAILALAKEAIQVRGDLIGSEPFDWAVEGSTAQPAFDLLATMDGEMLEAVTDAALARTPDSPTLRDTLGCCINEMTYVDAQVIIDVANCLDTDTLARMFLGAFPITNELGNPDARPHKSFALTVAETIGPDWAQAWYHFIVLVTKLA